MLRMIRASGAQDLPEILFRGISKSLEEMRSGRSGAKRVILVVPAQFTLKAEELAFRKLGGEGFFDLHIVSNNKLAQQIINETGGMGRTPVDTLGRLMLLRKIAKEEAAELDIFSSVAGDPGFLKMAGDLIVQLKQNNVSAAELSEIAEGTRSGLLARKLLDMQRICGAYDRAMEGRFNDSEDLRAFVTSRVSSCSWVCDAEFWYYDFYSFTRRDADFLGELVRCSKGLNIVLLSGDASARPELFAAPERTVRELVSRAAECGSGYEITTAEGFELSRPAELKHLESQLFKIPPQKAGECDRAVLRIVSCVSPHAQAEAIAVQLLELVRDRGYSAQDIAVLTNDLAGQGGEIKRVFEQYGIPVFMDEKRSVRHSPAVAAVCALLDIAADGFKTEAVLRFLKSGFSGIAANDEADAFENYVVQYRIKGKAFLRPFKYGKQALGEETFEKLEGIRSKLALLLEPFTAGFENAANVRERTMALYLFLSEALGMPDELEKRAAALAEAGFTDASEEHAQIWDVIVGLMEQACELLGQEEMSAQEYRELLESSFGDIKLGLLPQAEGKILLGTVDRTRLSGVKALFIAGANDGVLPSETDAEGILTEREQAELAGRNIILSKSRDRLRQEELLSVYRTFCEASEFLWIGYSQTDSEGEIIKPSPLIEQILSMFDGFKAEPDPETAGQTLAFAQAAAPAAEHMTSAFRDYLSGEADSVSDVWKLSYNSLKAAGDERAGAMNAGLFYKESSERLNKKFIEELYSRSGTAAVLSPSSLEAFSSCPFKFFVRYGLKPTKREAFEMSYREIGSIYHECLLKLCDRLSAKARAMRIPISDPSSDWMTVTEEDVSLMVDEILKSMAETEFDGLMSAGDQELYRTGRLGRTCARFAWQLIGQVRRGCIDRMLFETRFGRGRTLPPLSVDTPLGKVCIEGMIDRVDVIASDGAEYIRIIDYKSGAKSFDRSEAERGLALQLNIYLESALGSGLADKPAGMFYCGINDQAEAAALSELGAGELSARLSEEIMKRFRLNGLMVGERAVVSAMDKGIDEGESSPVLGVSLAKDGGYRDSAVTRMVSREEFDGFRKTVKKAIEDLCVRLVSGDISIAPRRFAGSGDKTACTYCDFRSICLFE